MQRISKMRTMRAGSGVRVTCMLAVASLALVSRLEAQVLTSGNSTAAVNPTSQAGMYNWTVDGVNQLNQQWFWFALNPADPSSIDTLPLTTDSQAGGPNTLALCYTVPLFTIGINYTLTGGNPGSGLSDIGESIKISNTSAQNLPFIFYEYSDFDLNNAPGGQTVSIYGPPGPPAGPGGFNTAYQTAGNLSLSETVVAPVASEAEANVEGGPNSTLAKLNAPGPVLLDDNLTATGAVTWAFEWDLNIAPGGSVLISKDKYLQTTVVPEPSVWALVSTLTGILVCAFGRRRKVA
jgi:hypothetical protein